MTATAGSIAVWARAIGVPKIIAVAARPAQALSVQRVTKAPDGRCGGGRKNLAGRRSCVSRRGAVPSPAGRTEPDAQLRAPGEHVEQCSGRGWRDDLPG